MTTVGIATRAGRGMGLACARRLAYMVDGLLLVADDEALDAPLDDRLLDRLRDALGSAVEDTGIAYAWAKRGVQRFVRQEAVRLGPLGARVCSVSPGVIDTPQGRQEAASHPFMAV